jgi:hypothetical protein
MKRRLSFAFRGLWGGFFLPRGWLVRAAVIVLAWLLMHLLGWREDTRIISGTSLPNDFAGALGVFRGVAYLLAYFAAVVVAPILVIGAGILWLSTLNLRPRQRTQEAVDDF